MTTSPARHTTRTTQPDTTTSTPLVVQSLIYLALAAAGPLTELITLRNQRMK